MDFHTNMAKFIKGQKAPNWNGFVKGFTPWNKGLKIGGKCRGKKLWTAKECSNCGKEFFSYPSQKKKYCSASCRSIFTKKNWNKGSKFSSEHIANLTISHTGKIGILASNWQGGLSFEPYSEKFNDSLKERIRKRDGYICQECHQPQEELGYKLHIHHIDYDKKNCEDKNLISLCRSCHTQTNFTRDDWTRYYQQKQGVQQ